MCNLYQMTPKGAAERAIAEAGFLLTGDDWTPVTVGPFGAGAFLVPGAAGELRPVVTCGGAWYLRIICGSWRTRLPNHSA